MVTKKLYKSDYKFNRNFVTLSAIGFLILLISTAVLTFIFGKINTDFKYNSETYDKFFTSHHTLITIQNTLYTMDHSVELMDLMRKQNGPKSFQNLWYSKRYLLFMTTLADHLKFCKDILGKENYQEILSEFGPLPQRYEPLAAFSTSINNLTMQCYYILDQTHIVLRDRKERSSFWFLITYIIGSCLVATGGLRLKKRKFVWAQIIKWIGMSLLLFAWIFQNYYYTKWEDRKDEINEIEHRHRTLGNLSDLYVQTRMKLGEKRLEQGGSINIITKMEESLRQYSWYNLNHLNHMLFSILNDEQRKEVNVEKLYRTIQEYQFQEYQKEKSAEKSFANYIPLCHLFHIAIIESLDEEISQLITKQSKSKYMLILFASIGTSILIFGELRTIRKEKEDR